MTFLTSYLISPRYVIAVRAKRRDRWAVLGYPSLGEPRLLTEHDALVVLDHAKRTCYKARMRRVR